MPNLPVISDLTLFATEVNLTPSMQSDASALPAEQTFGNILATLSGSPVISDLILSTTEANPTLPMQSDASALPAEQMFGNILTTLSGSKIGDDLSDADISDSSAPESADPAMISMMPVAVNQWINQPPPAPDAPDVSVAEPLSRLPENTVPNAQHPAAERLIAVAESDQLSVESPNENRNTSNATPIPANDLSQTTDPETLVARDRKVSLFTTAPTTAPAYTSPEIRQSASDKPIPHLQDNPQLARQSNENREISSITTVPANRFDQTADAASFAGSDKILPPPTTFATAHINSSINTTNVTANNMPAVTAEFGHPDWPAEFGQKITWLATQRIQAAELKLHPAHLGPIEISLQLSDNQQLTAQFFSHHAAVRDVIEANLPRLREIMLENGITLTDASVSADTAQQQAESGRENSSHTPGNRYFPHTSSDLDHVHTTTSLLTRHTGIIDTFA